MALEQFLEVLGEQMPSENLVLRETLNLILPSNIKTFFLTKHANKNKSEWSHFRDLSQELTSVSWRGVFVGEGENG